MVAAVTGHGDVALPVRWGSAMRRYGSVLWTAFASIAVLACAPVAAAPDCAGTRTTAGLARLGADAWGLDARSSRFQPASRTMVHAGNAGRLRLAWVRALASDSPRSYPLVSEDTIFHGDSGAGVVALDRETGCTRWLFRHEGQIGGIVPAVVDGRVRLFFSSRNDGVYALDAADGSLLWRQPPPGDNPVAMLSGTPLASGGRLFVPVSSLEIGLAVNPFYGCCTTSGGMAALDVASGQTLWYRRTIAQLPVVTGRHLGFVEEHAPSGAPVWGAPTLDVARKLLFFGTGQNYSRPATDTSDAIFAVDAVDGSVRWVRQFTAGDAFNMACGVSLRHPNCPRPVGPDVDFGAPPVLARTAGGRELLFAGQKSGDVHALDPDDGSVAWQRRLGRGGALGGVHWGMAVDEAAGTLFVPVSDADVRAMTPPGEAVPGLFALDAASGAVRWTHRRAPRCGDRSCSAGLSAAIVAAPGIVVAGSLDGYVEVLATGDGRMLWSYDTWRDFPDTVNGRPATGGAIDAHGPLLVDDLLIVTSGYGTFGQRGGNALLVFRLEPPAP
jgi:polyvinyl alcohol dehydrogenase (cytochrome)